MQDETTLAELLQAGSAEERGRLNAHEARALGVKIRVAGMALLRAGGPKERMIEAHEVEVALIEECVGCASVAAYSARFCFASYLKKVVKALPRDEREAMLERVDVILANNVTKMATQPDGEWRASALHSYTSFLLHERNDAERGAPFLETLLELVKHDKAARNATRYSLTGLRGKLAKLQGNADGRVRAALAAVDETRRAVGAKHADYAISVMNLGELYTEIGQYPEAKRALETAVSVVRERDKQVLGFVYRSMAELAEAEAHFDEALMFLDAAELAWERKYDAKNLDPFRARLVAARDAR